MLTIWGRGNSTNVKKVLWCAEELGVPYEQINAGGAFGLVNDPTYRAMNPNGLVPCIKDGDVVLWESNTIVRYLAAKYGEETLFTRDVAERASAEKWMDWATSTVAIPFRDVFWNIVRRSPEERDMAALEKGLQTCSGLMKIADAALADKPFLSGDRLGVGDIPLGCFAYAWFEMPIERPALPHMTAWYERLKTRPAYRKAVMIPLT
ncbi:glutathione S-transferase [Microvirga flavescens]|uniref:glutathione S-transferase n=1 Tax=Microvirga flavescens TaxID=2249811 RepID=UPI000DD65F79|nr:glutathione S-transferase [Microvirga flavescens]